MSPRRGIQLMAICAAAAVIGPAGSADASLGSRVRAVEAKLRALEAQGQEMRRSADRFADWESCISMVPVSEFGDPDRRFGYSYDERDGTGAGYMSALAVDKRRRRKRSRADYQFLDFADGGSCESAAPRAGGTADAAANRRRQLSARVKNLERRINRLKRLARRLDASSERFDEWESCVSWIPVTEYGDPDGKFGLLYGTKGFAPTYRPALAIDRSDWDDPDYMFLAFVGRDRPGRSCQDEPGEGVD